MAAHSLTDVQVVLDEGTPGLIRRFIRGEVTWAEVEGMTREQAFDIAQLGCQLARSNRLKEARCIFEGLLAGNPRDADAHAALGTIYQRQGNWARAREAYDEALALDAKQIVALANRGELRLRDGDAGGAADLARAIEVDPSGETEPGQRAQALAKLVSQMRREGRLDSRPVAPA